MIDVAIFKASYTKKTTAAKAAVRYIEHRPGKDNTKITRSLWGIDGTMERQEAYRMVDEAERGSYFFRFVISPDPEKEDTHKDINLRDITEQTLLALEDRLGRQIQWVAATHDDHAPHRHVHVMAILPRKLQLYDLQAARQIATEKALDQRRQRDKAIELRRQAERGSGLEWELQR